jgi:hypothetical protein
VGARRHIYSDVANAAPIVKRKFERDSGKEGIARWSGRGVRKGFEVCLGRNSGPNSLSATQYYRDLGEPSPAVFNFKIIKEK